MAARQTYTVAINTETKGAIRGLNNLNTALKGVIGLFAARAILQFTQRIIGATKEFERMGNQLRLITNSQKELESTFKLLTQAAQANRTSLADTVDLFTKLSVSTEELGFTQERIINVTGKLSKALQLAGADGNTASSVIRQFGQAMASGEVRGDEFRSLVEGLGPALSIMARESGISVGKLREMSQAGELTAETMFKIFEASTALDESFAKLSKTTDQLETDLNDAFSFALNQFAEGTGLADAYRDAIAGITRSLDKLSGRASLANATLEELGDPNSLFPLVNRIEELQLRIDDLSGGQGGQGKRFAKERKPLEDLLKLLLERQEAERLANEQAKAASEADAAAKAALFDRNEAIREFLKVKDEQIKLADKLLKIDTRGELQKAREEAQTTFDLIKQLQAGLSQFGPVDILGRPKDRTDKEIEEYNKIREQIEGLSDLYVFQNTIIDEILQKQQQEAEAINKANMALTKEVGYYVELNEEQQKRNELIQQYESMVAKVEDATMSQIDKQRLLQDLEENHKHKMMDLEDQLAEQRAEAKKQQIRDALEINQKNFAVIGKFSKEAFELSKAIQIANAIMGAHGSAISAFEASAKIPFVGPALAPLAAAASLAATMAQVQIIRNQQYPGRAGGGPVQKGQPFMVGEGGRSEMFIPSQNGTIVNQSQMGGMGAVNVTFNIDATDADGFDTLLVQRKNTIVSMVRQAVQQGRLA